MSILEQWFSNKEPSGAVTAFERVTLRLSGMRGVTEYEIVGKDGQAQVSQYGIRFSPGEDSRILERRALCDENTVLTLLNDCRLLSWDGFNGPHPKGVLDGTMFTLEAVVNGEKRISAQGSENFPKQFRAFLEGLRRILDTEPSPPQPQYQCV